MRARQHRALQRKLYEQLKSNHSNGLYLFIKISSDSKICHTCIEIALAYMAADSRRRPIEKSDCMTFGKSSLGVRWFTISVSQTKETQTHTHTHGAATSSPWKLLRPILQLELCPRHRQNPHQPMAQSQLRCHTGIMRSFPSVLGPSSLVRGPSSLFMVRTRSLATEPIHHRILFPPLFPRHI